MVNKWVCHPLDERRTPAGEAQRLFQSTPIPLHAGHMFRHWKGITPVDGQSHSRSKLIRSGQVRMYFSRSPVIRLTRPRFDVCVLGVTVDEFTGLEAPRTVSGWVDDPGLTLNASLTKVVENERFSQLKRAFQEELLRFAGD